MYQTLLNRYSINAPYFWDKLVFGERVQYRYVKELPCKDLLEIKDSQGTEFGFACTDGNVTYVLEAEFKKLSTDRQALGILHERLHSFDPAKDAHTRIAPFIATLLDMTDLREKQLNGDRSELTEIQLNEIKGLRNQAEALGFDLEPIDKLEYLSGGGVFVKRGWVSKYIGVKNNFVGVGSRIENSVVESSQVVDTEIVNARVFESTLRSVEILSVVVQNSTLVDSLVGDDGNTKGWERAYCPIKVEFSSIHYSRMLAHCSVGNFLLVSKSDVSNSIIDWGGNFVEAKVDTCRMHHSSMERNTECLRSYLDTVPVFEDAKAIDEDRGGAWGDDKYKGFSTGMNSQQLDQYKKEMADFLGKK